MAQTLPNGTVVPNESGNEIISATGVAEMRALGASVDAQLGARSPVGHSHTTGQVTGLQAALDAKDNRTAGEIAAGDDLDDYLTGGTYYCPSNSRATLAEHYPIEMAGKLDVSISPTGNGWAHQVYTTYTPGYPRKWSRNRTGTGWGAWEPIVDQRAMNVELAKKANTVHTHDDRYYTEAEVDGLLAGIDLSAYYTQAQIDARLGEISTAYQVAQLDGYDGTVQEWLASLVGPEGPEGPYGGTAVTDPQVASYVSSETETRAALDVRYRLARPEDFGAVGDGAADDTAAIQALLATGEPVHWGRAGQTYRVTQAITHTLTAPAYWKSEGARILGDLPAPAEYLLTIHGDGHSLRSSGLLIVDAGQTAHTCLRLWNRAAPADCVLSDVTAVNAYRSVQALQGGCGIEVAGAWERVNLIRPTAKNILMAAGAGVSGSQGVSGVSIYAIKRLGGSDTPGIVRIEDPHIEDVYSEDPAWMVDQDGMKLFGRDHDVDQTSPINTQYLVTGGRVRNARGRAVKSQVHHTTVDGLVVYRSKGGVGIAPEIDFQVGGGTVRNVEAIYEDGNVPRSVVNFSGVSTGGPVVPQRQVAGIKVATTGVNQLDRVISVLSSYEMDTLTTLSDISATGTQPASLVLMSASENIRQNLVVSNAVAAPSHSAIRMAGGSGAGWDARITVSSALNTGAEVPLVAGTTLARHTVSASGVMGYAI